MSGGQMQCASPSRMVARLTRITSTALSIDNRLLSSVAESRGRRTRSVSDVRIRLVPGVGKTMSCLLFGLSVARRDRVCSSFRFSTFTGFSPVDIKQNQWRGISRFLRDILPENRKYREIGRLRGIYLLTELSRITGAPTHHLPADRCSSDGHSDRSDCRRTVDTSV